MQLRASQKRSLSTTLVSIAAFLALMIYALKRDPGQLPSQLIGKHAPHFEAPLAQGGSINTHSLFGKGKWVIINFWSTSCVVCRMEAADLERFYQSHNRSGSAAFLSVNIQEPIQDILNYAKHLNVSYPIVSDTTGRISLDYGVYGTPETFFVDPEGYVMQRIAGPVEGETLPRVLEMLIQERGVQKAESIGSK